MPKNSNAKDLLKQFFIFEIPIHYNFEPFEQMRLLHRVTCLIAFAAGLFLLSSCSTRQHQLLFSNQSVQADSIKVQPIAASVYHIMPQDVLQIRNLQNVSYITGDAGGTTGSASAGSSSGQTYQVEDDGTVALPVIGHIKVSGLTRYDAEKQIETLYRKTLLKDPIIEVKIINLKVTLLGEVKSQGNYPLTKEQTTLVDVLGTAGGLTDRANEKTIKIIRGDKANPQVTQFDLSDIKTLADPRLVLQNNDIVYVAQSKRAIRADNLQNVSTIVQPALLLLNTALIIISFTR